MSVGIATLGMYNPPGDVTGGAVDAGSTPYAHGGGVYPGAVIPKPRLKVTVKKVNTYRENTEIKVHINND
jgi:hypothetical protein